MYMRKCILSRYTYMRLIILSYMWTKTIAPPLLIRSLSQSVVYALYKTACHDS